jgi:hypothetical protein
MTSLPTLRSFSRSARVSSLRTPAPALWFTELVWDEPQLDANVEGLLQRGPVLRQPPERVECLFEPCLGVRDADRAMAVAGPPG